ncbi:MAG: phosphoglucosamine mutase [Chlorobi bacterium]|nr:phosphoglucosamine mutase [Chlorobiota bacterium]
MKEPIISISGIRGIFGESLTPEHIVKFTTAFASYIGRKRVVIGRDGRLNGDLIEKIVESTLLFNGCEVINIGIAPTPAITFAVESLKAQGGISITASHNPQQWNGMKFINSKGIFFDAEENSSFLSFLGTENSYIPVEKVKQVEYYPSFSDHHIKKILSSKYVNLKKIRKRKFKVVADCVNSSGSNIVPEMLKELGCKVHKIDCNSSGVFTRDPEPVPENLKKTCKEVKKKRADLGIVVDPDGDRLVIITEKGEPFGEENTVTTAIKRVLSLTKPKKRLAVVNFSTSRSVDDVVSSLDGKLYKSPVGEINVIKKMLEVNAVIGGEGSGGVIVPEIHYSRDALAGIALLLSEFAEFKGRVSDYKKSLPQYYIKKSKIGLSSANPDTIIGFLKSRYMNFLQNTEDGLRIDFESSWVNFRKSNTEPIIRIITEAKTLKEAESLQDKFLEEIKGFFK